MTRSSEISQLIAPLPVLLSILLLLGLGAPAAALEQGLGSGQSFPDMQFTKLTKSSASNEIGSIADHRGKKLMVHIFASW